MDTGLKDKVSDMCKFLHVAGKSVRNVSNERSSEVTLKFKGVKDCRSLVGMFRETDGLVVEAKDDEGKGKLIRRRLQD